MNLRVSHELTHLLPRNGRADLQGNPVTGFSTNRFSNLAWGLSTPIRVGVRMSRSLDIPCLTP